MALGAETLNTGPMTRPGAPLSSGGAAPAEGEPAEPTGAQLSAAAATFALLANPARLHLAWLMVHESLDVGTLAARVGASIPTTSQHLAKLRLAGVATSRRDGRYTFYRVEDPHVRALVEQIFSHIAPDGSLAPDP